MSSITEAYIEETALSWFQVLGYQTINRPDIAPGEGGQERETSSDVVFGQQ